jgi:uncharacterized DUF497 family protein
MPKFPYNSPPGGHALVRRFDAYTASVYTSIVIDRLLGFDWDGANEDNILRHSVTTPNEVEEAVSQKTVILTTQTVKRARRWKSFGKTLAGRHLVVVFTVRRKLFRAVTAYDVDANERRAYAPKID